MAAGACADAACHDHLRLEHLFVDLLDDRDVLLVDATRDQEDVSVLGVAGVDHAEALGVEAGAQAARTSMSQPLQLDAS